MIVRTAAPLEAAITALIVAGSDTSNGIAIASATPSPFGVTVGGWAPSPAGRCGLTVGATVSIRNVRVADARLPAASVALNTTVWIPSPSTATVAALTAFAGLPSMLTTLLATPDVASVIEGLRVTGPRQVDAASPALPVSVTPTEGATVSMRNARCRHGSRMPARSTAR